MLEGDYPFGVGNGKGVGRKGDKELHRRLRRGWEGIEFPRHFHKSSVSLLKRLFTAKPSERASCQEALDDDWFKMDSTVAAAVASDLRKLRGVRKRSISEPDLHKCDHFTKTGSGQT
jgi:serine/threonine protein kinase